MTDFPPDTPRTFSRRQVLEAVPATALAAGPSRLPVTSRLRKLCIPCRAVARCRAKSWLESI